MGGTYTEVDGVLYPDITVSEEPEVWVGKYGLIWMDYMKANHTERYRHHIRMGTLKTKAFEVNEEAYEMLDRIAAAKVAERIVDVVHEKIVKKEVPETKDESERDINVDEPTEKPAEEPVQLPKKPEKPALLSKYPSIMKLYTELKRRNDEIFAVEQERSNLEIELSECTGVFKQKRRKELQERITLLDRKAEKMKSEFSKVLRESGYANAAEFFTELFAVREEKRKYEEACKVWQEECVRAEIEFKRNADKEERSDVSLSRSRSR